MEQKRTEYMAPTANDKKTVREAVAIFEDATHLQAAMDELLLSGFTHTDLSVLADAKTVEKKLGHSYKQVTDEKDNPDSPRTVFMPPEVLGEAQGVLVGIPMYVAAVTTTALMIASGGTLLPTLLATAAAMGGSGLIGALLAKLLDNHHADYIQEHIDRGGLLLWVSTSTPEAEKKAVTILKKHSAYDIDVHDIPV